MYDLFKFEAYKTQKLINELLDADKKNEDRETITLDDVAVLQGKVHLNNLISALTK